MNSEINAGGYQQTAAMTVPVGVEGEEDKAVTAATTSPGIGVGASASSSSAAAADPLSTLPSSKSIEENVNQLANSVSSWWSGFSKRSTDQIAQAQEHIRSQGGIVNFAKNEATKLEKQIEEARNNAIAQRKEQDEHARIAAANAAARTDTTASDEDREDEAEGGQPQFSTAVKGKSKARESAFAPPSPPPSASAQIFDADDPTAAALVTNSVEADAEESSLLHRLQTLSSDPRVASIQKDLSSRLSSSLSMFTQGQQQNQSSPSGDGERDLPSKSAAETSPAASLSTQLRSISTQLSSLASNPSALSSSAAAEEARQYATKYWKASEEVLGKMSGEVKELVGDLVKVVPADVNVSNLVKIVPPQSAEKESVEESQSMGDAVQATAAAAEDKNASTATPTTVGSTISTNSTASGSDSTRDWVNVESKDTPSSSKEVVGGGKKEGEAQDKDGDSDSDWE